MGDTTLRQAPDRIKYGIKRRALIRAAPALLLARGTFAATPRGSR